MSAALDISALRPGQAMLVDWSDERYHGDTLTVGRTQLDVLRDSPQRFHALYVARTLAPDPPGSAMVTGTHVHLAVLEPEKWARRLYAPCPERPEIADGRAKKGTPEKDAYVAWKAAVDAWEAGIRPDSIVLTLDERARIEAIAASIRSHSFVGDLLRRPGVNEQTILWREPQTGVLVRVRLDRKVRIPKVGIVVLDLKSSNDPAPPSFAAACARYGYHRQDALYFDAVAALHPDDQIYYALAVVCTSAPYEPACYQLDDAAIDLGREQYLATLHDLVRRRETNDWRAPWQQGCRTLSLPRWAFNEE